MYRLAFSTSLKVQLILSVLPLLLSSCVPPNKTKLPMPFPITIIDPITINNRKSNGTTGPSGTITVLEFEKLKKKVESFPKNLSDTKSDIYSTFIDAIGVGVGIAMLIIVVIGIVSWLFLGKYISDSVAKKMGAAWEESFNKWNVLYGRRVDDQTIDILVALGFFSWEAGRFDHAINQTERALTLNPKEEQVRGRIQSNLAYYYAERGREEDRGRAIELATDSVDLFHKYPHRIAWLANDIFTRVIYAQSWEELNEVVEDANRVRRLYPDIRDEINEYLELADSRADEFRQIGMM